MKRSAVADGRCVELLQGASELLLIGLLLERPHPGWLEQVDALSTRIPSPELKAAAEAARQDWTEGRYLSLFGPGGVVSPRQAAHVQGGDPGRLLADLLAFYSAFSFHPRTEEPPDHVSVETGFLGYLRLKEAYAAARGNQDAAEVTAEAARRFCQDHLCGHARALAAKLDAVGGARPLSLALRALTRQLASLKTDGSGGEGRDAAGTAGP